VKQVINIFLLILYSGISFAFIDGDTKLEIKSPIDIQADKIDINANAHRIDYFGHVQLRRDDAIILADKASTFTTKENTLRRAVLYSIDSPVKIRLIDKKSNRPIDISANKVIYFPKKNVLSLYKNVEISQNNNYLKAPFVEYDLVNKRLVTTTKGNERTHIRYFPEKTNASNSFP
jgi:lipopolysaccharide transport protein LptA